MGGRTIVLLHAVGIGPMSDKRDTDILDQGQGASWKQMLAARPVQNAAANVERTDADSLKITVQKQKPRFMVPPLSWVMTPKLYRTVVLAGLGREIWDLCDGSRTVEEVVDAFADRYRLSFHESRAAVTGYMKLLVQRGALAMVVSPPTR